MGVLNKNNSWFVLLILFFFSCSKKSDVLTNKKNEEYYKYKYSGDTILCIHGDFSKKNKSADTTIFYKKENDYYVDIYNPIEGPTAIKSKITFSINKDTFYNYNVVSKLFYFKIEKINDNKFKTTYANYDSLTYKYRRTIFYDRNYKIYKIEAVDNDEKIVFEK